MLYTRGKYVNSTAELIYVEKEENWLHIEDNMKHKVTKLLRS